MAADREQDLVDAREPDREQRAHGVQRAPVREPRAFAAVVRVLLGQEEMLVGTVEEVVARLKEHELAGVERVFLQHLDHADLDMVGLIGKELVPALA